MIDFRINKISTKLCCFHLALPFGIWNDLYKGINVCLLPIKGQKIPIQDIFLNNMSMILSKIQ